MTSHIPVLASEIVTALALQPGDTAVDGTCGGGGHTRLLAKAVQPQGTVIATDRDPEALGLLDESFSGLPVQTVNANYCDIPEILDGLGIDLVQGILLDLGLSSDQLDDERRGFSYNSDGVLDLRFDPNRGSPAWKLLDRMSEKHLADLIYEWGEERFSRRIARAIVSRRSKDPIRTADALSGLLRRVVPRSKNHSIDPATRTFQALRIAVNDELKWVSVAAKRLPGRLSLGGRIAVISFHSLEDRIIKNAFRENESLKVLSTKPIRPDENELANNPRSRSAKLRVAERIA